MSSTVIPHQPDDPIPPAATGDPRSSGGEQELHRGQLFDLRFYVLLAAVLLSRIPLMSNGYGSDPDAWRVADVAHTLVETGTYAVSRFPGYPLHELICAGPIALAGSWGSNGATLLCGLISIVVFHLLAREHLRHAGFATICLAFAPLFWVNSAATMDYVWSLLFVLLAIRMAVKARATMTGMMIGIAAGFRPSNFIMVVPIAILLILADRSVRRVLWMGVLAVVSGIVVFLPVFLTYGVGGWLTRSEEQIAGFSSSLLDSTLFAGYRAVYSIGPLAAICIASLLVLRWRVLVQLLNRREPMITMSLSALTLSAVLFFAIPAERGYLLAALPFLLILVDATATRNWMIGITVAMISFAFVNPDVIMHTTFIGRPGFNIREGMVVQEINQRKEIFYRRTYLTSHPPPAPAVVMTGTGPVFWVENDQVQPVFGQSVNDLRDITVMLRSNDKIHYTPMLSRNEVDSTLAAGTDVWCVSDLQEYIENSEHYRMQDAHVSILSVPPYNR